MKIVQDVKVRDRALHSANFGDSSSTPSIGDEVHAFRQFFDEGLRHHDSQEKKWTGLHIYTSVEKDVARDAVHPTLDAGR